MILLHNTATLLQPRYRIFNLFKWLWKCQDNPFVMNSTYLKDWRIYFGRNGLIRFAHGLVTLGEYAYTTKQFKRLTGEIWALYYYLHTPATGIGGKIVLAIGVYPTASRAYTNGNFFQKLKTCPFAGVATV